MATLKDRQRQIPNGLYFELSELKYRSTPYSSFDTIVNSVHTLLNANPEYAAHRHLPLDLEGIRIMVDRFNANICRINGWKDYYNEEACDEHIEVHHEIPYDGWPLWAKLLRKVKVDGEVGLGDTVERLIGKDNSEAFKTWYVATTGRKCNCQGRKRQLNIQYRY